MSQDSKRTVIEDGTAFDGAIISECPITLSGSVKGELTAPTLVVESSGTVEGQISVTELRSKGEISGEIDAETVELSGTVNDSTIIRATTLEVKLQQPDSGVQVTFGNCELQVGENVGGKAKKKKTEVVDEDAVLVAAASESLL